jgi:type I restriction enzyme S subunit
MKKENKPQIRFKDFTDEWKEIKLGDLGEPYTGLSGKTKNDFGHGEGRYITYMNVFSNPIAELNLIEKIEIDSSQNEVIAGDVLFTVSSETPNEVGMSSVWTGNISNIYLNSFCFGYRPKIEINNYFLANLLRAPFFRKKITFLAQGISRYNISKNKVMELCINIPETEEQNVIGVYFNNVDKLITEHEKLHSRLSALKIAMLSKMFPQKGESVPKIRFNGFTENWVEKEFYEILNYERPDNYIVKSTVYSDQFKTPVLTANKGFILGYTNEMNTYNSPCIIFDDFTLDSKLVEFPFMVKSSALKILTVKDEKCHDLRFTFHRLVTKKIEKMGHARHYISVVQRTKVLVPNIDEQIKIANYFEKIDHLITYHEIQIKKLTNLKKALLAKLFI